MDSVSKSYSRLMHCHQDFICTPDHMLYPIECNPRVHTAICLLVSNKFFASAYIDASSLSAPVIPTDVSLTKAWIGHDLPALILPRYIPALNWLHSFIGHVNLDPISSWPTPMQILVSDPTFTLYDPLPFYALYHIQWPALLALQLVKKRTKWSRVNLSTSRIFEC